MAKKARFSATDSSSEHLVPGIKECTPLYSINSTAFAAKIEYDFKDSLHSSVAIFDKVDGKIPSNLDTLNKLVLSSGIDYFPHFSPSWAFKLTSDPKQGNVDALQDTVDEIIL
jgi:hypothetical protein